MSTNPSDDNLSESWIGTKLHFPEQNFDFSVTPRSSL